MVIKINNIDLNCKVVSTPEKIIQGMMNKTFDGFDCMLFLLPKFGLQSFWMKNCIIPLDILFIDDNHIESISHNCPPCKSDDCPSYKGYGSMVLELPGGYCKKNGITIGDKINFQ
jgi:uncharacterized membrane protein (UPF0127 family)